MNPKHSSHRRLQKRPFGAPQKLITVIAMCKGFDRGDKTKCEKEWRRDIIAEKKIIILMNNPSEEGHVTPSAFTFFSLFYLATKSSMSYTWNNNNTNKIALLVAHRINCLNMETLLQATSEPKWLPK